jgi:hypothetical protein
MHARSAIDGFKAKLPQGWDSQPVGHGSVGQQLTRIVGALESAETLADVRAAQAQASILLDPNARLVADYMARVSGAARARLAPPEFGGAQPLQGPERAVVMRALQEQFGFADLEAMLAALDDPEQAAQIEAARAQAQAQVEAARLQLEAQRVELERARLELERAKAVAEARNKSRGTDLKAAETQAKLIEQAMQRQAAPVQIALGPEMEKASVAGTQVAAASMDRAAASMEALAQGVGAMAQATQAMAGEVVRAVTAPKRLVRDPKTGRAAGVESVL